MPVSRKKKKKAVSNSLTSIRSNCRFCALLSIALCSFVCIFSTNANAREMTEYPRVKLQSLDKITARTMTFEAEVGSTLRFGSLYIRVQKCKKASPIEKPESAAFMQIWEINPDSKPEWVFSGWMFSSSPALSAMDHPIYDVWVLDCLVDKNAQAEAEQKASEKTQSEEIENNTAQKQDTTE